jgi:hypothetical protein
MQRIVRLKIFFTLALAFLFGGYFYAQCSGCTTNVANGVASYTAASGQTLCVASGLNYTGTLVLNGGTICNSGTVNIIDFRNGTFRNYGVFNAGNVSSIITGTINVHNYTGSAFNMGAFTFSANNAARIMNIIIYEGASATFTSNITKNQGALNFEIGNTTSGMAPTLNSSLTVNGLFTVKTGSFAMTVQSNGTVSVSDILSLESTGVKSITNYGTILLTKDLNMISAGSSASTVTINNYGRIDARAVNASYTAGRVFVNNYIGATNNFNISTSMTLSRATNTLNNTGRILITQNLVSQLGLILNSGTITPNNLTASGGTITNNNVIKCNNDLLLTNSAARLNNNKSILIANTFSNIATINTATESVILTKNYYNSASSATINGVTSGTDTLLFPRIIITHTSSNSGGHLKNKLFIYDASLTSTTSNIGFGFDAVSSTTRIAATVVWGAKAVGPGNGNPPVVNCPKLYKFLGSVFSPPNPTICAGTPLNVCAQFGAYYYTFDSNNNPILLTSPVQGVSSSNYVWSPGNLTGDCQTFTPLSTTIYTVSVTYTSCVYSNTYMITVSANTANISNAPVIYFAMPDPVSLSGSIIGGTPPYSYVWTPNMFFQNPFTNTQQNTQVNPQVSLNYTLTVTDFYGCIATKTITVIAKPYAFLNKLPDGGYYIPFNDKLLFEFDGQYAQTGLVYRVYDKTNTVVASNTAGNIASSLVVNSGDNRYYLDVSSATFSSGAYYTLELINEKNEKLYLKFKK